MEIPLANSLNSLPPKTLNPARKIKPSNQSQRKSKPLMIASNGVTTAIKDYPGQPHPSVTVQPTSENIYDMPLIIYKFKSFLIQWKAARNTPHLSTWDAAQSSPKLQF
jgi:hypothetical protein